MQAVDTLAIFYFAGTGFAGRQHNKVGFVQAEVHRFIGRKDSIIAGIFFFTQASSPGKDQSCVKQRIVLRKIHVAAAHNR
ncbi:hypothetical protein D3C83_136230 [compost metagenome]